MKIGKILLKIFVRVMIASGVLAAILYALVGTEGGMQFVWGNVARILPQSIHVGRVEGTLLTNLGIYNVTYRKDNVTLTIKSLELHWQTLPLLRQRIVIDTFNLDGLHLTATATGASSNRAPAIDMNTIFDWLAKINFHQANFHDVKVDVANAQISLEGSLDANWHLQWYANVPALQQLTSGLRGQFFTNGNITGPRLQPTLAVNLQLQDFSSKYVSIKSVSGQLTSELNKVSQDRGELQIKGLSIKDFLVPDFKLQTLSYWSANDYLLNADITLSQVNHITAAFRLPSLQLANGLNQAFTGSAKANVNDFAQFNTLFRQLKEVKNFAGKVTGAFTGSGTIAHPIFDGGLTAENGSVYIPSAALSLQKIKLVTRYRTGQKVGLSGEFTVLDGRATLSGTYDLESASLPLQLEVNAENLVLYHSKYYKVKLTPSIKLFYQNDDLTLSGSIFVPEASIHPTDFSTTATLPSDVVIVNQQNITPATPTNITLQMQLILGDHVKIRYHGLNAGLQGKININGVPGSPLTATGEFTIAKDSQYQAYGKQMQIQEGRLIYAGNLLTNPGISLRATQTVKTVGFTGSSQFKNEDFKPVYSGSDMITVGIAVSGTVDKPLITLFSDPAGLSQGDILSYLLFGYPQSQASGASSLALLSAASDMVGGSKKGNIMNRVQQTFGLDELSVGSTEYYDMKSDLAQNTTTVNIGRNLGSKLSLHYSVGLFQPVQVFSLRYLINKHLVLQTETSTQESGGDLLYQLESRD